MLTNQKMKAEDVYVFERSNLAVSLQKKVKARSLDMVIFFRGS